MYMSPLPLLSIILIEAHLTYVVLLSMYIYAHYICIKSIHTCTMYEKYTYMYSVHVGMIMYICSAFSVIHVILSEPVLSNTTKEGYAKVWYQI